MMKRKVLSLVLAFCLALSFAGAVQAETAEDIVILFDNDVHCAVDGYAKLSAMKAELSESYDHVGLVSAGDFIQGGSLGVVSRGEYIVNIMNLAGYDAVTLGNHEFDYRLERLLELEEMLDAQVVCSNFKSVLTGETVFAPYTIVSYGDTEVAFVGITTPDTLTSSAPSQFADGEGGYLYSFEGSALAQAVQSAVDAAGKEGADYVVALSHLGTENVYEQWSVQTLIQNVSGLDAVLDGHSHSVVESLTVTDKDGREVPVASTGTAFANIGMLTLSEEGIKTRLIPVEGYEKTDEKITAYIEEINEEYQKLGERKIGVSQVRLTTFDEQGRRMIRNAETNLGDLCADAYRLVTGADIGFMNGGGIRADIDEGDITFNELLGVFPWNNKVCLAEVTGQQIVDMLELGLVNYPEEDGTFQHVSGITFDLDPTVPSTVKLDENMNFVSVEGARRVSDVMVENRETGAWEPIQPDGTYTLASHSYLLMEYGGGATMFREGKILSDTGILDVELLETYITEYLGGVIGEDYRASQDRIHVKEAYIPLRKTFEAMGCEVIWTPEEPRKIVVNTEDVTMVFTADTDRVTVDGTELVSDRAAYIEDGVTYISGDCVDMAG